MLSHELNKEIQTFTQVFYLNTFSKICTHSHYYSTHNVSTDFSMIQKLEHYTKYTSYNQISYIIQLSLWLAFIHVDKIG